MIPITSWLWVQRAPHTLPGFLLGLVISPTYHQSHVGHPSCSTDSGFPGILVNLYHQSFTSSSGERGESADCLISPETPSILPQSHIDFLDSGRRTCTLRKHSFLLTREPLSWWHHRNHGFNEKQTHPEAPLNHIPSFLQCLTTCYPSITSTGLCQWNLREPWTEVVH